MTSLHIDIDHIAELGRLALSDEEKKLLTGQLDSIAVFMSDVQSVDTSEITLTPSLHRNIFAPDVVTEESGSATALLVRAAPDSVGEYVTVPQVITAGKHTSSE